MNNLTPSHARLPPSLEKHLRARYARVSLALWSFAESFIFPIPPDPALMLMALAKRAEAYLLAFITTAASVAGGVAGYFIGAFWLADFLLFVGGGSDEVFQGAFDEAAALYRAWGGAMVFLGGFTLIPYKVITIFSGAAGVDFALFVVMSILSRGLRFYCEAWLVRMWGEAAWRMASDWLGWRMLLALIAIGVVGVVGYKVL